MTQENANATIKQKPTRRSKRLRGVVAFTYDRNLGGGVGGILVRGKQTQAPSHYNNGHLASDVCRQVRVVVRVKDLFVKISHITWSTTENDIDSALLLHWVSKPARYP